MIGLKEPLDKILGVKEAEIDSIFKERAKEIFYGEVPPEEYDRIILECVGYWWKELTQKN